MRYVMKRVNEVFRQEQADKVLGKMSNIIGRKLGVAVGFNPISMYITQNNEDAYIAIINGNDNYVFSYNVLGNDINSITVYKDIVSLDPVFTIDLKGYNIIQVLDEIVEILKYYIATGSEPDLDELMERGPENKSIKIFMQWLNTNKNLNQDMILNRRIVHVYNKEFSDWLDQNRMVLSLGSFKRAVKAYLDKQGLENAYAHKVVIVRGTKVSERPIASKEDRDWEKLKAQGYEDIFDQLRTTVIETCKGTFNALYVYGGSGIGKSKIVNDAVYSTGAKALFFSGGIKSADDLANLLYKYKNNYVLVFDDFDSAFKDKNKREILLAALEDSRSRNITWINKSGGRRPDTFEFTSSIIIISNSPKIDRAILDRSMTVPVVLTKEEILVHISRNLKEFMPKIPLAIKDEVMEFLMDEVDDLSRISFRQFKFALGTKLMRPDGEKWKIWAKRTINAGR